jgi:hypothetical protein
LGIRFKICPNVPIDDGIHAVRMVLPRCYFDRQKTSAGVESLLHYRRDWNQRIQEFKPAPVHDWASHGADAFRYLAVRHQTPKAQRPTAAGRGRSAYGTVQAGLDWMSG